MQHENTSPKKVIVANNFFHNNFHICITEEDDVTVSQRELRNSVNKSLI
jgi:hypothetical protein